MAALYVPFDILLKTGFFFKKLLFPRYIYCVVKYNTLMPVILIKIKGRGKYYSKRDLQDCYTLRSMMMIIHCLTP